MFPSMNELVVSLCYCYIEYILVIKTENLESPEIFARHKFTIYNELSCYSALPQLKV
jgi:hypothetical protein